MTQKLKLRDGSETDKIVYEAFLPTFFTYLATKNGVAKGMDLYLAAKDGRLVMNSFENVEVLGWVKNGVLAEPYRSLILNAFNVSTFQDPLHPEATILLRDGAIVSYQTYKKVWSIVQVLDGEKFSDSRKLLNCLADGKRGKTVYIIWVYLLQLLEINKGHDEVLPEALEVFKASRKTVNGRISFVDPAAN